jgi:2-polyprenyl-3-methyl-5-hydroxy-6-metoxy-1,4-benzoquinol methylase
MNDNAWLELSEETYQQWEKNASFWDEHMGEGNDFQNLLIGPTTERLLNIQMEESVLDIACGNGNFSRRLARLGARVVAFDQSHTFIERAISRTTEEIDRIEYLVIDATEQEQLLSLGEARFDSAVCNMAIMDISDIEPLLNVLPHLLKPHGCIVFSVTHPCFNFNGISKIVEEKDLDGEMTYTYAVKVSEYITPTARMGIGVIGQPVPHYYFHRPLHVLLNSFFEVGFVLDRIEEPVFDLESNGHSPFSWNNFKEIPPVIIVRMRLD